MKHALKFLCGLGLALLATCGATANMASAQTVPFFIVGSGEIPDGIPLTPGESRPHESVGYATSVGFHSGSGGLRLLDFTSPTTANFESSEPYKFKSLFGRHTLACNYGVVPDADEPGEVELFFVDQAAGIVIGVFLAEFTPDIPSCTGKFKRLKGGSFTMLAVTEPFQLSPSGGVPVAGDANGVIDYSWVGIGSLKY